MVTEKPKEKGESIFKKAQTNGKLLILKIVGLSIRIDSLYNVPLLKKSSSMNLMIASVKTLDEKLKLFDGVHLAVI